MNSELYNIMFPSTILHGDFQKENTVSSNINREQQHKTFMQMIQKQNEEFDDEEFNDEEFMPPLQPLHTPEQFDNNHINHLYGINYPYGPDFSFIKCEYSKMCISSAYDCIMNNDNNDDIWKSILDFKDESYMFSKDHKINKLMNDIDNCYDGGHSGSSLGWTMRQIERIAHIGFDKYKTEWINYEKTK